MSIDLPRSRRALHFTGSVKALGTNVLGQERPKVPPPLPPERSMRYAAPLQTNLPTVRGQLASMDEDLVTAAISKEELDAALFPIAKRPNGAAPAPNLPVPCFRSAEEVLRAQATPPVIIAPPKGGSLPLGVWIAIAVIAGIVSFNFAPQARESVAQAMHALDSSK
jgi:hypothetical protein